MKAFTYIFIILNLAICACQQPAVSDSASTEKAEKAPPQQVSLKLLADYMIGSFNSAKQAGEDSAYFDISLEMSRIWAEQDAGIWLYVEQAVTAAKQRPYRQRVYQLQQIDEKTYSSTVYSLPQQERFVGAYTDSVGMGELTPDSLILLTGCDIRMVWEGEKFEGKTGDTSCRNSFGDAAYATSIVTVTANQLRSWDQGWNEAGEQVWGAEKGPYVFDKIK